jgi:hypothetical protein
MAMPDASGGGGDTATSPPTLEQALATLDPDDDAAWTADGLPRMDVLEALIGDKSITREQVDAIGFTREKARQYRAEAAANAPGAAGVTDETESTEGVPPAVPKPETETLKAGDVAEIYTPAPEIGDIVDAYAPPKDPATGAHDGGFDGEMMAAAIVVKVNDDGTVNLRVFAPNGGADISVTGVHHHSEYDTPPNVVTWA